MVPFTESLTLLSAFTRPSGLPPVFSQPAGTRPGFSLLTTAPGPNTSLRLALTGLSPASGPHQRDDKGDDDHMQGGQEMRGPPLHVYSAEPHQSALRADLKRPPGGQERESKNFPRRKVKKRCCMVLELVS